jgi:carboxypeptidase T
MKRFQAAVLALAVLTSLPAGAHTAGNHLMIQQQLKEESVSENVYKAYFPNLPTARKAAITFHNQMMEARYSEGYLVMELSPQELAQLATFGFRFERATEFLQQRNEFLTHMQGLAQQRAMSGTAAITADVGVASIPNYACYETVEETFTAAQGFTTTYPNLAAWIDAGNSWEKAQGLGGYDIFVLKLTNKSLTGDKPKLFVNSAIHAREYTTAPLNLSFARWLLEGYGTNADATWILDHHEVHLMLHTNPDGRKRAETGLSWRKNTNQAYCGATSNTRGADLNRNFTFQWNSTGGQGSSGSQCDLTYRGPSAGSEPETQAIQSYVRSIYPDRRGTGLNDAAPTDTSGIHIDLHSYSELVLWPWGTTSTPAPNGTALQTLGRRFAFFNGYTPQQSIGLYPTDGTSDGVSYGELGVAAYTIELGTAFFQSCTTYNNTIQPNNLPALIYAAKVVRTPYLTPAGPDVTTVSLSGGAATGGVAPGTPVTLTASVTDTRFNNSNGTEPTQAIAAAEYFIDVPPWQTGAVARALTASDGSFNATTEGVTGSISTTGLAAGKHIVYVRGRDAGNNVGPVTASFLVITDGTPPPLNASFTSSCSSLVCSFDGNGTTGSPTSFQWNFGDGSSATGATATHTYAAAGTYTVTLTVTGSSGSDSESASVVVTSLVIVTDTESNNTLATAQVISGNPVRVNGTMASSTDGDYFRVTLAAGRTLTSTLRPNASSDYDLYVYNSSGSLLGSATGGTGAVDTVNTANTGSAAVTVYVRVRYYSGGTGATNGVYTLDLTQ